MYMHICIYAYMHICILYNIVYVYTYIYTYTYIVQLLSSHILGAWLVFTGRPSVLVPSAGPVPTWALSLLLLSSIVSLSLS